MGKTPQERGQEFEDFVKNLLKDYLMFDIIHLRWIQAYREIDILAKDFLGRKYIIECKEARALVNWRIIRRDPLARENTFNIE